MVDSEWTPSSWRSRHVSQPVNYPAQAEATLGDVLSKIRSLPPLVTYSEASGIIGSRGGACDVLWITSLILMKICRQVEKLRSQL